MQLDKISLAEQSILSTLVFFDIFNYPLTLFEIWKWQYKIKNDNKEYKISEIQEILETSNNLKRLIRTKNGFYYLKGKENLIWRRLNLYRDGERRWKKLRRIVTILQMIPNVLLIAACNTLPINDFKPESDIDVFIIVKRNRLWLTRFLVTILVAFLGQWRHKKKIAERICLSFYITDEALNLKTIAKTPYDIYLTYWIALVAPLYRRGKREIENKNNIGKLKTSKDIDIYSEFLQANSWVKEYLPNFIGFEPVKNERKIKEILILKIIRKISEAIVNTKVGDLFENFLRRIQKDKIAKNRKYRTRKSSVVVSDKMLKFHEIDRRDEFREKFELRMKENLSLIKA